MIHAATKYGDVRRCPDPPASPKKTLGSPSVFIPRWGKELRFDEWYWKELREGGMLYEYIRREKATSPKRMRAVARKYHKFEQNKKSDFRLRATVPAREWMRWKMEDEHFWEEESNLKSFLRDNPEAKPWSGS